MTVSPNPTSLASKPKPNARHGENGQEIVGRDIKFGDTLALVRAVAGLKVLQTTTAVMRVSRNKTVSIHDQSSSLHRAIDRKEKRIASLLGSMAKYDTKKIADEATPQNRGYWPPTPPETFKHVSLHGDGPVRVPSNSSESMSEHQSLAHEAGVAMVADGNVGRRRGGRAGEENRVERSGLSSSVPAPNSDSIYSSLGRSLSESNIQSISSCPRQCRVVSATQYTRIVTENEPQFSFVSQPWSIDSLVAESPRIDRSALEISEHPNEQLNHHPRLKSADSFPGRFPVSEGLRYSSLATAKHHARIPSIRTSVRPFSDL
ncbi:uncharacterized protein BJX67DRAFT_287762 [Aspergillus lucknowensis]|uniref:Uncharacterized protein n=1 Tax=Aspergillus lucknowensis TaxID=176173 RepID=A0ABR4LEG0_9EURO